MKNAVKTKSAKETYGLYTPEERLAIWEKARKALHGKFRNPKKIVAKMRRGWK
jgi:hypothetical protein